MSDTIHGEYHGERKPLFGLALRMALLTALTLGIYRFWAKTRIRKYIWSSVAGDGDGFEYTGTGLEMFLGFLMAMVILAVYLGILQMILFFFGLSLLDAAQGASMMFLQFGAFAIPFVAVVPLIFFAQYRARRYKLARTRWRGVRFGMEKAAWGYVWRAILHWMLSIATLGLLFPRQTFWLEKYKTDRTWFGDAQFHQEGRWTEMYGAMKHILIGVGIVIGAALAGVSGILAIAVIASIVGYVWIYVGFVSYRVRSFIYLTNNKVLDGTIRFRAIPETGRVVKHLLVGGLIVGMITALLFSVVGGAMAAIVGIDESAIGMAIVPIALTYLLVLSVASALTLVMITQPIIHHITENVAIANAGALDRIRQRAADTGTDAEGFADALDIGGGL